MLPSIRPNVLRMQPYQPGKPIAEVKRELGLDRVVKLASNENPYGPSPKAVEAVQAAAREMHVYPDGAAHDLRQALMAKWNVAADEIILGNGSDELIHLLGLVFLSGEDDEMVVGDPSFVRYDAAAQIASSRLVKVPLDSSFTHDLTAMARQVNERTKLLFIANPNNPTGTIVRKAAFESFLNDLPASVVVVLDEAYYEFAQHLNDYPSSLDYLERGNVVGLRTFSKAYGLAGIRVGYGFAPPAIVDAIERAREPFNVNSLAQVAAVAALGDDEHVHKTVENNRLGLDRISKALIEEGAAPCESFANFVFADFGRPARPIFQALLEEGVIVRPGDALGKPNCLRISVGTEDEMNLFVQKLRQVMRQGVPA